MVSKAMSYGHNAVLETVEQIITQIITIPKSPPPCNCKKRVHVLAMACHAIKQRSIYYFKTIQNNDSLNIHY